MQRVRKLGFAYISMVTFFCDCFLANALGPSDPEGLYRSTLLLVVSAKSAIPMSVGVKLSANFLQCVRTVSTMMTPDA